MSHKTMVNGTAYEIDGGKAMVDGTVYEIDHGVANVDGTAYEVGLASDPVITIIFDLASYEAFGETNYRCGEVIIGDTNYGQRYAVSNAVDQCTLTLPVGTVIGCIIRASGTGYAGEVRINGKTVLSGGYQTYEYTVTTNATIVLTATVKNISNFADSVYITEL